VYPLPEGFKCSGIISGIKEDKTKKDLGLIVTDKNALLGAVYTQNKFPSAHVSYCRNLTPSNQFRALIVNSGNANAATGNQGIDANSRLVEMLSAKLALDQTQVFTSSTGIIGVPFPLSLIEASLDKLIDELNDSCNAVSEAIMTTDLKPKLATEYIDVEGQKFTISGFAKGSGMIHPNMATMLAYVLTDAPIPFSEMQPLVKRVCDKSFNCISVDGDTSTNDSFYLISSAQNEAGSRNHLPQIEEAIEKVAISLAKQIAADGEGANHLIEATILEGSSESVCRSVLHAILTSNLVKTAVHGKDPNWGRLLMAAGNGLEKYPISDNSPFSISIQGTPVLIKGEPANFDKNTLSRLMDSHVVKIELNLHAGNRSVTGWGCDLSNEYIHINADYTT
jgi:glutamate N-acetyltransferase/amino-acid N-acetyltransferase